MHHIVNIGKYGPFFDFEMTVKTYMANLLELGSTGLLLLWSDGLH